MQKIRTRGDSFVDGDGRPLRLRGPCLGGRFIYTVIDLPAPPTVRDLAHLGSIWALLDKVAAVRPEAVLRRRRPAEATVPFQQMIRREFPSLLDQLAND